MTKKAMSFESSMERLEEILHTLESGTEDLDTSLKLYEEGISLVRACSTQLQKAEQKIKILQLQSDGSVVLEDFGKTEEKA
ncbi:MAG: exodeoxyribonuclease VII small subunit [Clostridia bacterium]|nr:exodeoxyribonuclease VII small subunit [Clostridia bacterium]